MDLAVPWMVITLAKDGDGPTVIEWALCIVVAVFIVGLMSVGRMLRLRMATRCPKCLKPWAREELRKETGSVHYKDTLSGGLTPVTHIRHKVRHRCRFCGHEWTSTAMERIE